MLNPELKLNPKLFDADVEQKPTRDGYGDGLVMAGEHDPNVVVLCADLSESTRSYKFQEKFSERFFEVGVAEQNMATVAAGLGISGKIGGICYNGLNHLHFCIFQENLKILLIRISCLFIALSAFV